MPKVSIVLPSYNGEKYIRQSIESVINQTFTDWELIIVNDCSSDRTREIVGEYSSKDKRISLINNDVNQKLPKSLNIGFRVAKGEYLTWTSDDNMYETNALDEMTAYLDVHIDCMFVCSDMRSIDVNGMIIEDGTHVEYSDEKMLIADCVGASFMYRKSAADEVGQYDESLFLVEDYDYWLRFLFRYGSIGYIDKPLYAYRRHGGSLKETKENDINRQLCRLRKKYLNQYLEFDKETLSSIFFGWMKYGIQLEEIKPLVCCRIPELSIVVNPTKKRKIIYGAGAKGLETYKLLNGQTAYFADGDVKKVGTKLNGIDIISVDEMIKKSKDYEIVIAVDEMKIWQLLKKLYESNVIECTTYQIILGNLR